MQGTSCEVKWSECVPLVEQAHERSLKNTDDNDAGMIYFSVIVETYESREMRRVALEVEVVQILGLVKPLLSTPNPYVKVRNWKWLWCSHISFNSLFNLR